MAKQRKPRPAKRNLVRWSPTMDQRLLLSIQYACNQAGIKIPFNQAGTLVGEHVTEGAIVQHLAKLRGRLIELGESVPPLLKRGGGYAAGSNKVTKNKAKPKGKKTAKGSDSGSDNEDSDDSDAYAAYDEVASQGKKDKGKGKAIPNTRKEQQKPKSVKSVLIKKENSEQSSPDLSTKSLGKRPRQVSTGDSEYEQTKKLKKVAGGHSYALITRQGRGSGDRSEEEDGQEEWVDEAEGEENDDAFGAQKTVAAGAPFLEQESDSEGDYDDSEWFHKEPTQAQDTHSYVAKLPIGRGSPAKKLLHDLGYENDEVANQVDEKIESPAAQSSLAIKSVADWRPRSLPKHTSSPYEERANEYSAAGYGDAHYSTAPLARSNAYQGFEGYNTSGNDRNFAHGLGGLDFGNDNEDFTTSSYGGSMPGNAGMSFGSAYRVNDSDPGWHVPAIRHTASASFQAPPSHQQFLEYPMGNGSFTGGQGSYRTSPNSTNARQHPIKYEQIPAGHRTSAHAYGVPQQSTAPTPRESFNSSTSTNMPPTPSGEPFGAFDAFVTGDNGFLDFQAGLQGGDGGFDTGFDHFDEGFGDVDFDYGGTGNDSYGYSG